MKCKYQSNVTIQRDGSYLTSLNRNVCYECTKKCGKKKKESSFETIHFGRVEKHDKMITTIIAKPQLINAKRQSGFKILKIKGKKPKLEKIVYGRTIDRFKECIHE